MLHDLVLSLLGLTGDIVEATITGDVNAKNRLKLNPLLTIETYDRDIIEGLLALGSMYMTLHEFVDNAQRSFKASIYQMVIAKALDEEILAEYESQITVLEHKLLDLHRNQSINVSLSALRLDLWDKYWQGFEILSEDVLLFSTQDDVIDRLIGLQTTIKHKYLDLVVGRLIECVGREIISWCKYGIIAGGHTRSRFFIRESLTMSQTRQIGEIASFQIDRVRIPARLIEIEVCQKILFCGRAVIVLKDNDNAKVVLPNTIMFEVPLSHKVSLAAELIATEVEKVRAQLSTQLSHQIKNSMNPNIVKHLENIKGLFLMGFGDQWVSFIEDLAIDSKVNNLFRSIFNQVDESLIAMDDEKNMSYRLPWPMDLVIPETSFDKYREIFRLLYRIQTASIRARYSYNMQLTNLFIGLQSYLQTDLIQVEFERLIKVAKESEDVQVIALAHESFLDKIHLNSLSGMKSFEDQLDVLFRLSDNLAIERHMSDIVDTQIKAEMMILIRDITELRRRTSFSSLEKLLTKLDFTNFYRRDDIGPRGS